LTWISPIEIATLADLTSIDGDLVPETAISRQGTLISSREKHADANSWRFETGKSQGRGKTAAICVEA
jgi:hypothetical protein